MKKDRGTRTIAVIAIIVAILGLTIGYSALSQTLTITGSGKALGADWLISFANLSEPILTGDATAPSKSDVTISDTSITLNNLTLRKPGDTITYTFDIANTGDINAKIGTITTQTPTFSGTGETSTTDASTVQDNFQYQLLYDTDNTELAKGDLLNANSSKKVKLIVSYKESGTTLPKNDVEINSFGTQIIYTQQ